jgi:hypothetical protein
VENAQNAFPTSSLDGAQNAPPTRSTGVVSVQKRTRTENNIERGYNNALHRWRLIDNTDVLASLRSDHDHVDCVITMGWTK